MVIAKTDVTKTQLMNILFVKSFVYLIKFKPFSEFNKVLIIDGLYINSTQTNWLILDRLNFLSLRSLLNSQELVF